MSVEIDLGNGYSELFMNLEEAKKNLPRIRMAYPGAKIVTGGSVEETYVPKTPNTNKP